MSNFYIQRSGKAVGPLSWDRLETLLQTGKLQSDTKVSDSPQGPWVTASEMQAQRTAWANPTPVAADSPNNLSAFELYPQTPPASVAGSFWAGQASSPSPASSAPRSTDPTADESQQASFLMRCCFPWIGENSKERYGNLDRYIKIFKSVNRIAFLVGLVLLVLNVGLGTIFITYQAMVEIKAGAPFIRMILMSISTLLIYYIGAVFCLAIFHLLYIASMAMCDFLRLMIDVEANTRASSRS